MKIEIIKECAGMSIGTIKTVQDSIAKNLIERGLAKSADEKEKKTSKKQEPKED